MSSSVADGRGGWGNAWWIVAVTAAGFLIWSYAMLRGATLSSWQDTEAYLGHSLYIAEHGGLLGFLRESFTGAFPITERHPLYMLLLAPFASRAPEFFLTAKFVDLFFGLVVLLTLVWMVARRYGKGPALIAAFLYAVSSSLVTASSHVNNEMQFVLCTLWTWWFLTQPDRTQVSTTGVSADVEPPLEMPLPLWRWAVAGLFMGLAYLVKSPASLIGVAVVLAGVWWNGWRFLVRPQLWVMLLVIGIVSSPLAVRNLVGFGTPVYEGVNSNIMWIDRWTDIGNERTSMYYDRYGIMTVEKNGLPTASEYFHTHGIAKIAKRLVKGVITEVTTVAPKALGIFGALPGRLSWAWGAVILAFAVAGWWLRRRSWEAAVLLSWSALFAVFFGWDNMFPDIRYLAPLVPIWIAFAAHSLWSLARKLAPMQIAWRSATIAITAATVLLVGATVTTGALTRPQPVVAMTPSYANLIDWFDHRIEAGDRVLIGPTMDYYGLLWMVERPVLIVQTPNVDSLDAFQRYLRERKVRYLVMHRENVRGWGGSLADALAPYVEAKPDGTMLEKQAMPGWHAVYRDAAASRFIVYESDALTADASPGRSSMSAALRNAAPARAY